ncbi:LrgB family protein [Nocardioides pacificus]
MSDTLDWLRTSPLVFLVLTLLAYRVGVWARDRSGGHALAQPSLIGIVLVGAVLLAVDVDYGDYFSGTELISFLMGPATVALAVPLHRNARRLHGLVGPMLVAIPLGAVVSVASALLLVRALGGGESLALTMAPRAATTPVAIALAEEAGGVASLTAVLVIVSGVLGAIAGPAVLTLLRIRDPRARGLAMGASAHGIGTSRSLADDETEGAFAGLSMGLTALAISALLPLVVLLLT